jgi:putative ATP-binding cassette transporter
MQAGGRYAICSKRIGMASTRRRAWSRFWRIARPYFTSEVRWRALGLLAALLALLLALSGLNVVNSYVGRDFMTAIAQREPQRYYWYALAYLAVFAASTIAGAFQRYTELSLGLRWREWLTRNIVHKYLSGQAYYRVNCKQEIDNPDQRISQDLNTFTTTSLSFFIIIVSSAITVAAFAGVLWTITPWLLLAAVAYPAIGTTLAIFIGHRLVALNNLQLKKEADFRYELVHAREHAVSLVVAHHESQEETALGSRLRILVDNYRIIIRILRNLKFFSGGYNYLTQLIPVMIVAPLYMRGQVEFGVVTQAAMAFSQVFNAFSLVVEQFQDISTYSAVINRVDALVDAIEERPEVAPAIRVGEEEGRVAYEGLTVRAPKDGRPLIRDLALEVPRGKRLLITGPNGAGKSALFRATAGAWEWGQGHIVRPPRERVVFLPQRPFLTPGTLRDQLAVGKEGGPGDDRIVGLLRDLKLGAVLGRVAGLDDEHDWAGTLSLGEQQLLGFAKLLLATPDFAFLDHATSALGERDRENAYQRLSRTSITYISVGDQHPVLMKYHDTLLELQENGEWKTGSIEADKSRD